MRSTLSFSPTLSSDRPTSSLTRKPLAYINSNMVRSRRPNGVSVSGAASKASTWNSLNVLGTRRACLAASNLSVGSVCIAPSRSAQRK